MNGQMGSLADICFGSKGYVGLGQPAVIVAEIGINHEGDKEHCMRLIEAASRTGADAVKLQTADPDENYIPGTASYDLFRSAFLGPEGTAEAFQYARALGMEAFTTTGMATFEWIERLRPAVYKISSSTLGHFPLVRLVARSGRPVIMSTGMAEQAAIAESVEWARHNGVKDLVLLQCTSLYPCPPDQLDIAAMRDLGERFSCLVGLSDHSLGQQGSVIAVAAGARMIEKHFSLDTQRPSFDHGISLDEVGFRQMVQSIREAEAMLGSPVKRLSPDAAQIAHNMRRYLVARRAVESGEVLQAADVGVMRLNPGVTGLRPAFYDQVVGARARRRIGQWDPLLSADLDGMTEESDE